MRNRSVTINPARMCQPIGAMYALFGVHAAVPLVHGSQGCAAYPMRMFNRHFGELVQVAVSSLGEDASVFGGKKNLIASRERNCEAASGVNRRDYYLPLGNHRR